MIAALYLKEHQFRLAFIKACIVHGCLIVFSTELLSLTRSLDFTHVASFWLITSLVSFSVLWNCYRRFSTKETFKLKFNFETLDRSSQISISATIVVLLISLITALIAPPNNWDSMTYHMSRVMHWIQNRTVAHYPSHSLRQISFLPGASYIVTHLQILAGSDRFANCVQWLSFVGSICGISLITKRLVGQAQWISLVLCASIPMAIAQSTTAQTDLVTSFWLVCFTYFLFASSDFNSNLFWIVGSFGLALVTKPTAIIFGTPLFLTFGFLVFRRSLLQKNSVVKSFLSTVQICSIVGFGSLTFPLWNWIRNARTLNQFLGIDTGTRSEVNSLPELISVFLKNLSLNLTLPGLKKFITLIHDYFLNVDINNPALTFGNPVIAFSTEKTSPLNLLFSMEDTVANPIHLILGVLAVSYLWISYFRRTDQKLRTLLLLSGAIAIDYGLYCYLLKWQPWGNRLLLPLFILQTPIISYYLANCLKLRSNLSVKLMSLIGVVAILYALTPIRHPLVSLPNWSPYLASEQSESILWLPRQQIYFSGSLKYLEITYRKIVNTVIDREHCHTIGLISEEDDWEYPLWVLLNEKTSGNFRLKHVEIKNESAKLEPEFPDSELCAIVSTKGRVQPIH